LHEVPFAYSDSPAGGIFICSHFTKILLRIQKNVLLEQIQICTFWGIQVSYHLCSLSSSWGMDLPKIWS